MAMLQKIRANSGLLIVIIGIGMLGFLAGPAIQDLLKEGPGDQTVGEVYGDPVGYQPFYELYQQNLVNQTANSDEQRGEIWQSTWEGYVNQLIFEKEYVSAGVDVPGDELFSLFLNPPQNSVIRTIPSFQDSTRQFNPAYVRQGLNMLEMDPRDIQNKQQLDFVDFMKSLEEYIYQNRLRDKYFNLVKNSTFVSANEARRQFKDENTKFNISYVAVNYNVIPDDQVTVSDADLRNYLSKHKEEFKQENEVTVRYVKFPKTPSQADTASARSSIDKMMATWKVGETDTNFNDTTFLVNYSGRWDTSYLALNTLPFELASQINDPEAGSLYGPVLDGGTLNAFKVMGVRESKDDFVRLRHILVKVKGFEKSDTSAAKQSAKDLLKDTNGDNFSAQAMDHSADENTSRRGGYLGWVGATTGFGAAFDKAVAKAKVGDRFVTKSAQGFHIVELQARTNKRVNVASVSKEIFAGTKTLRTIYNLANRFAGKVHGAGDIDDAITDGDGLNVAVTKPALNEGSQNISGLTGAKPLIDWALAASDNGEIANEVIETGNAYIIAQIGKKTTKGYQSLEDVREAITGPAANEKKAEIILAKLNANSSTNLDEIVSGYGQGAFKQDASGINFNSQSIPLIGSDPLVIGKICSMQLNQVSQPIKGMSGVYVIQVTNITEAPEMQDAEIQTRKMTIGFQKKAGVENKIFQGLREIADVKDFRYNFKY